MTWIVKGTLQANFRICMVSSEHNVNVYGYFLSYPTDRSEVIETNQKKKNIEQHFSLKTKFLTGLKRSLYFSTEILFLSEVGMETKFLEMER